MFQILSKALILVAIISSISTQKFCDNHYKGQLVDYVFNFNETVYAYRKPNSFWVLSDQQNNEEWQVKSGPLKKSQLFENMADNLTIRAVLAISSYKMCDRGSTTCRNSDRNFNPTNVTFVFDTEEYVLYRRESEEKFGTTDPNDPMIPWNANDKDGQKILQSIQEPLGLALFMKSYSAYSDYAVFLTYSYTFDFDIIDKNTQHTVRVGINNRTIKDTPKHGAILHKGKALFFMGNEVWDYNKDSYTITPTKQTYWQFFRCRDDWATTRKPNVTQGETQKTSVTTGSPAKPTATTETPTDKTTTNVGTKPTIPGAPPGVTSSGKTSTIDSNVTTEESDKNETSPTEQTTGPTKGDQSTTERGTSTTDDYDDYDSSDPSKGTVNYPMESVKPSTTEPQPDGEASALDPKAREQFRHLAVILFAVTLVASIITPVVIVFGYITLSKELKSR